MNYSHLCRVMTDTHVDIPCVSLDDAVGMARHNLEDNKVAWVQILERVEGSTFKVIDTKRGRAWAN